MGYLRDKYNFRSVGEVRQPALQPTLKPKITPTPPPTKVVSKPQQPQVAREIKSKFLQGSNLEKVGDVLGVPSYLFGGFLSGARKKAEELKGQGIKAIPESIFSGIKNIPKAIQNRFGVSDYLAQLSKSKEAAPLTKKIAGSTTAQIGSEFAVPATPLGGTGKVLSPVVTGLNKLTKASSVAKRVVENPAVRKFASLFIKGANLSPENKKVIDILDEIPTKYAKKAEEIIEKQQKLFGKPVGIIGRLLGKKQTITKEGVEAVPKFLEPKGAGKSVDLGKLKTELGSQFEDLKPILKEEKKISKQQIYDLVKEGVMDGETAKRLLTQGGYFPHVFEGKPSSFVNRFVKVFKGEKRGYLKKRKGTEGFTYNAPKAFAIRELNQTRDTIVREALESIKIGYGQKLGKDLKLAEGHVAFLDKTPKHLKSLKGYSLPKDVADYLNQTLRQNGPLAKTVDTFNALWKPTATNINPAFHLMNMMGNVYNSWLGGVRNPKRLIQMAAGNFSKTEQELLKRSGILSRGQFGGDVGRAFNDASLFGDKQFFKKSFKFGLRIEDRARGALFLDAYEKAVKDGLSGVEAMTTAKKTVNKFLFDYLNSLTPFEHNVMRRIFPFYTWARNNIPLQLRSLIDQPESPKNVAAAFKVLNKGETTEDPGLTIPTPFKDAEGKELRYRANLPIQDILEGTPKRLVDMLNPLFKEAPQLALYIAGKFAKPKGSAPFVPVDLYTGRERTRKDVSTPEQLKDISVSEIISTLRPIRSYQKVKGEDFTSGSILRSLVGGFYKPKSETSKAYEELDIEKVKKNTLIKQLRDQLKK